MIQNEQTDEVKTAEIPLSDGLNTVLNNVQSQLKPEEIKDSVKENAENAPESACKTESVSLGKFKNPEQLYNAYLNLEKEFTRKSQQLKELSKTAEKSKKEDAVKEVSEKCGTKTEYYSDKDAVNQTIKKDSITENDIEIDGIASQSKNEESLIVKENKSLTNSVNQSDASDNSINIKSYKGENADGSAADEPFYVKNEFKDKLDSFIASKPLAKEFFKEIGREILNNEELSDNPDCLNIAYHKILESKYQNMKHATGSEQSVIELVENNSELKTKIIGKYLDSLKTNQEPPRIGSGGIYNLTSPVRPRTISEAGQQLIKSLKQE